MAAPKGNNFNPAGRPEKPIDWEEFEKLCGLQCTQSEMAGWFKIDPETLHDRVVKHYGEEYSVVYKKHSETGKCSLRRTQLKLAQKSPAMAIFLGKQQAWLGQTDAPEEKPISDDVRKTFSDLMMQLAMLQASKNNETASNNYSVGC